MRSKRSEATGWNDFLKFPPLLVLVLVAEGESAKMLSSLSLLHYSNGSLPLSQDLVMDLPPSIRTQLVRAAYEEDIERVSFGRMMKRPALLPTSAVQ